jgi:hypothetical protein
MRRRSVRGFSRHVLTIPARNALVPSRRNGALLSDMKEIPITQGYVALVDDEDFDMLSKYSWNIHPHGYTFYARTSVSCGVGLNRQKTIRMHRLILGCSAEVKVDHRDGNGLNNTRKNLRYATYAQNNRNARLRKDNPTGFKGVHLKRSSGKFQALIRVDKVRIHLGSFVTPEEAHAAYCKAAKKYFGAFARFK